MDQYNLKLFVMQELPEDREILVSYGAKHSVREHKVRAKGMNLKRKKGQGQGQGQGSQGHGELGTS